MGIDIRRVFYTRAYDNGKTYTSIMHYKIISITIIILINNDRVAIRHIVFPKLPCILTYLYVLCSIIDI